MHVIIIILHNPWATTNNDILLGVGICTYHNIIYSPRVRTKSKHGKPPPPVLHALY